METTLSTLNFGVAVALGTCGVVVDVDKLYDDPTGRNMCRFWLSATNTGGSGVVVDAQAVAEGRAPAVTEELAQKDGQAYVIGGPLRFETAKLLARLRDGALVKSDPVHPFLDALRALNNRERLLSWIKRGDRYRLAYVTNAPRMVYEAGGEPMMHRVGQPGFETWETQDLKLAAALALAGVPVVGVRQSPAGAATLTLPRTGYDLGGPPVDAVELVKQFRSGELAKVQPGHPLLWGYQTLQNRERLLVHANQQRELVLLRRGNSGAWQKQMRSALVESDARDAVLDRAAQHLRRV